MLFFSKGESEYRYNLWRSDLNTIIYNKLSQFISQMLRVYFLIESHLHAVQYTLNKRIKVKKNLNALKEHNALKEQYKSSAW